MGVLESFLRGDTDIREFIERLKTDDDLRKEISGILPDEIAYDKNHPFREKVWYPRFEQNGHDRFIIIIPFTSREGIL